MIEYDVIMSTLVCQVEWVEQQYGKKRVKRDLIEKRDEERAYQGLNFDDEYWDKQWYLVSTSNAMS